MMRIAIIGTGGVGGYIGAKLHYAGNEVVFAARGSHLRAMQTNGLKLLSPEGDISVTARFTETLAGCRPLDCLIIGVKSFDTGAAVESARPAIGDDSIVLSIQNGVENEELIARLIGRKHVLTGIAYIFSTISEPGTVKHEGGAGKFRLGEMDGSVSERCRTLEKVFRDAGMDAEAVGDIGKYLWQKWIFICALGGMTAFSKKTIGEILTDPELRRMLKNTISEASQVARGMYDDPFTNSEQLTLAHCERLHPASTSSMYYDLTHGKRVEVDALNGAAVRLGEKLGISAPANGAIYSALKPYAD